MSKLQHDATDSSRGTLYQLWVVVQKCYEMSKPGQKVLVEIEGDVTIAEQEQVEVKQYNDALTDNHICFWKTLYNWIQDSFDPSQYFSLVLFTTQEFGPRTKLVEWNNKSTSERMQIIEDIYKELKGKYDQKVDEENKKPEILKYHEYVLDPKRRNKLEEILERFIIEAGSPKLPDLYADLKGRNLQAILEGKRDDFMGALYTFITSPKLNPDQKWEITYDSFCSKIIELTETFRVGTIVFPSVQIPPIDDEEIHQHSDYLFVKKIEDIQYREVIPVAINDYQKAMKTIHEEFQKYLVSTKKTDNYVNEIHRKFNEKYRNRCRNCTEVLKDSKNFYDDIIYEEPLNFEGFKNTSREFRNGILHSELNDEKKDLKWRLERDE